jgi:putative DNA primase/helicase
MSTDTGDISLAKAALDYAARGIPVFPSHYPIGTDNGLRCSCGNPECDRKAKHPRTEHGFKDATTLKSLIEQWWAKWPNANIGIPTGAASGFDVIDIDNETAQQKLKEIVGDTAPAALQKTGRGWQLGYAHAVDSGLTIGTAIGGIDGLDFRGDGGYIIAAPSRHINGNFYAWVRDLNGSLPPLPAAFIEFAAPINHKTGFKEQFNSAIIWEGIQEGQRDDQLFRYACQLRAFNAPEAVARDLVSAAAARCNPPFGNAQAKVDQAYKYPAGGSEFVSAPREINPAERKFDLQTWGDFVATDHGAAPFSIEGIAPDCGLNRLSWPGQGRQDHPSYSRV